MEVILVLLDLSSAFDTIDHAVLIQFWRDTFGISGLALALLKLFLQSQTQWVQNGRIVSEYENYCVEFSQGSVLGLLNFCMCMYSFCAIIYIIRGIENYTYTDDTQLYISCDLSYSSITLNQINMWIFGKKNLDDKK